jgi:hypothetical protein
MYKSLHNTFTTQPGALQSSHSSQKQEHQQWSGAHGSSSGLDSSHGNGHQANSSSSSGSAPAAAEVLPAAAAPAAAAAGAAAPSAAAAAGVEDALKKAQQALAAAESSLDSIHKLRSAQPPNQWAGLLQVVRSVAVVAAAGSALVASHAFGLGWQWAGATLGALGLAGKQTSHSGCCTAAYSCTVCLLCYFVFEDEYSSQSSGQWSKGMLRKQLDDGDAAVFVRQESHVCINRQRLLHFNLYWPLATHPCSTLLCHIFTFSSCCCRCHHHLFARPSAARAYQRNAVTPAAAFAVAAACLATLGCSLRFGVVMLAYAYTSHKLRQFKEGRQSVDYDVVRKPQQLLPRDWPEVRASYALKLP